MIRFNCDYSEGAHPTVLDMLLKTNMVQTAGYGEDAYCVQAAQRIKDLCGNMDVDVHFLVGGTQTNMTFIASALRPHQGVLAADTGHINTHESGAIEATGHKVLILPNTDGKITAQQIQNAYDEHFHDANHEHIVQPKLVYLSNATEMGSIYTDTEMKAISAVCRKNSLILYMDGARLGVALCADGNDLTLEAIAKYCDAFYIGGTKNGMLFGEALVICNENLKEDFRYIIKQKGGMLAKGRLLGVQFLAVLEDGLFFKMAKYANQMAMLIRNACIQKGYSFLSPSLTNQQFPILPNKLLDELKKNFEFSFWQKIDDDHSAVRFCTSWATQLDDVLELVADISRF